MDVEDKGENTALRQAAMTFQKKKKVADTWHLHICYSPLSKTDMSIIATFAALTAPWLLCSAHPELSIMPIHGGDNETCVSSLTFIIMVV